MHRKISEVSQLYNLESEKIKEVRKMEAQLTFSIRIQNQKLIIREKTIEQSNQFLKDVN